MQIVAIGNPFEGITFYGPFKDNQERDKFLNSIQDTDWWVIDVYKPEQADV